MNGSLKGDDVLVSAIVSVYRAEKYIAACLDDLEQQTISDRMEIIVIDSGSDQNESEVILRYQNKYNNIKYIRTAERETVYAAWNRGIRLSSGEYITNANTDDRHRKDAYAVMVAALEQHPEIALVYADLFITEIENQTFDTCTPTGRFEWLEWDRQKLLEGSCFMGPQPMWRRSVHKEYGYFKADFITSGDYEFWLRISQTHEFLHLHELLGLYLKTPTSIEHSNRDAQTRENKETLSEYRAAARAGRIIHYITPTTPSVQRNAKIDQARKEYWSGNDTEAARIIDSLINGGVQSNDTYIDCIQLFLKLQTYERALHIINTVFPEDNALQLMLAKADAQIGLDDFDAASTTLSEIINTFPEHPYALNLIGVLLYEKNELESAVRCFQSAIENAPNCTDPCINLALVHLKQGAVKRAFKIARAGFLRENPTRVNVIKMAQISDAVNDTEKMNSLFRTAVRKYPENKTLIYHYVSLLLSQGSYGPALDYIEKAIIRFSHNDGILEQGLTVRKAVGPLSINEQSAGEETISLCLILTAVNDDLARCLASAKMGVDEIVAIDMGASVQDVKIAELFGARIFPMSHNAGIKDPWQLANQLAKGTISLRLKLDDMKEEKN